MRATHTAVSMVGACLKCVREEDVASGSAVSGKCQHLLERP